MWIASQDGKIILEAVKFKRFDNKIEVSGRDGSSFIAEYNDEKEAKSSFRSIFTNLRLGENACILPKKEEEDAESQG